MGAAGDSSESKVSNEQQGKGEEGAVVINIRCSNGTKFTVRTSLESTVGVFKSLLAQNCDVPPDQQRLIYKGRILKDDQTLHSYGLQADHTIHMVRGFSPAPSTPAPAPAPAPVAAANPENPDTTTGVTRGVGSNEGRAFGLGGAGIGASLFPGLGSLGGGSPSGLFGDGLPELEQVQQRLAQNPDMMREIMNAPAMQSLMNNPELIRSMMMSNPQMREIMDRNPELAHVLNDPSILRQTLESARNPELMREMMRHTDRAMSNIESTPEGFNMLRRMYENVQEPFLNATTMGGNAGNDLGSNPFATLLGNQGLAAPNTNPLPNPWNNAAGGTQTNSTARPNPAGRASGLGGLGLGGLGLPGMDNLFNSMPDSNQMTQLLQNPAVSQMMQSLLSNPEYMNQMLNFNPQLRGMVDSNPQLREMMQNPELLRQLTSPENNAANANFTTVTSSAASTAGYSVSEDICFWESAQPGAPTGTPNNSGLDMLMNMFGGLGAGSLLVPNQPDVPPEELYATQLSQLQEMGFFDTQENIRALRATAGNVHAAVERLLGNLGQ
ncbi:hypothetical protein D5086_018810 [Populus alba]|uniref:Ubiquitin domain-containing protein DSK2a-like n=2 Tax=Populus alba TaxID=43335 RepID=A0A4U5PYS0_POPAL|nr:hypothetical protein D5086_0000159770 [Populus alba]